MELEKKVNLSEKSDSSEDRGIARKSLRLASRPRVSARREITIGETKVDMLIDTGAEITCLNLNTVKSLALEKRMRTPTVNMTSYTNERVPAVGEIEINLSYQGRVHTTDVLVVNKGDNLLGVVDSVELGIVRFDKRKPVTNIADKINKYSLILPKSSDKAIVGRVKNYCFGISLKPGRVPFLAKERGIPFALRNEVGIEIKKMIDQGILAPSHQADWVSPIVVVKKANGKLRICGDFRKLNDAIMEDKFPLPKIEDLIADLGANNRWFAKLDLEAAYHQIPLREECQGLTTVITHLGTFKFKVMPFGLKTAPSAFQRVMKHLVGDMKKVLCYLDDILVASSSKHGLRRRLQEVKSRLTSEGFKINEEKCIDEDTALTWLGYEISAEGVKPAREKVAKIVNLKPPTCVKEVRQLLGVVNYYNRYIPRMAEIAEPIHALLRNGSKWRWGKKEDESLERIKVEITREESLLPFDTDPSRKTFLTTDASDNGIGAVLEQEDDSFVRKPISYWSSKLRCYEKNYSISEKEALACVAGMLKFKKYLMGRNFVLRTDHRALIALVGQNTTKVSSARTERWREKIACFNFSVEYIRGKDNSIADWLSRSSVVVDHEETPLSEEFVINEVKSRLEGTILEYGVELNEVLRIIEDGE